MSYSPPDPYHHSNSHARQYSLPTVCEDSDPYRVLKKSPQLCYASDNGSDFDVVHSRTASDSSTSRLCTSTQLLPLTLPTNNVDDPYTLKHKKWKNPTTDNFDRANSYLPYSHHQRDPNQKAEPIYIEEYTAPASTMLGTGSMLHDNMSDQVNNTTSYSNDTKNELYTDKTAPEIVKKKRKRRFCGMGYLAFTFLLLLFVIAITIIWYFVWPRIPNLVLDDVDNVGNIQVETNSTKKSMSTSWSVNMTADNSVNWVPTRFNSIDLSVIDYQTNEVFGYGSSGSLVLPAKKQSIITIPVNIYYTSSAVNDTTFQNLYNACGVQQSSPMPFENRQDVLNITFHFTFHIPGIIWPTNRYIPVKGLVCPTS